MSDRSPGWGLGAHAFVIGGIGRSQTDQLDGSRYFGEGGGGVTLGPVRRRHLGQVRGQPVHDAGAAQRPHDPDQRARDADLLMSPADSLRSPGSRGAVGRRRGSARPAASLKPLLETLARSTAGAARRRRANSGTRPQHSTPIRDDRRAQLACAQAAALDRAARALAGRTDARLPRSHRRGQRRRCAPSSPSRRSARWPTPRGPRRRSPRAITAGRCTASPSR